MWIFFAVLIAVSLLIAVIGVTVYRGRTGLIHDYHQEKVKEENRLSYGRAVGRGLLCMAAVLFVGGLLPLFSEAEWILKTVRGIVIFGILLSVLLLIMAQKKYNR